jgi:hypothetical protein
VGDGKVIAAPQAATFRGTQAVTEPTSFRARTSSTHLISAETWHFAFVTQPLKPWKNSVWLEAPVTNPSPASQAYFWTAEWQAHEAEVSADLAAGRYKDFATAEDAIAWIFAEG